MLIRVAGALACYLVWTVGWTLSFELALQNSGLVPVRLPLSPEWVLVLVVASAWPVPLMLGWVLRQVMSVPD